MASGMEWYKLECKGMEWNKILISFLLGYLLMEWRKVISIPFFENSSGSELCSKNCKFIFPVVSLSQIH